MLLKEKGDGMYSEFIEDFLKFLRSAEETYNINLSLEKEKDDETQDLLHELELGDLMEADYELLSKAAQQTRQERRVAKDTVAQLSPVVEWIKKNRKTIQEWDQVLGKVRKAEESRKNRYYRKRTDIIQRILGEERMLPEPAEGLDESRID